MPGVGHRDGRQVSRACKIASFSEPPLSLLDPLALRGLIIRHLDYVIQPDPTLELSVARLQDQFGECFGVW